MHTQTKLDRLDASSELLPAEQPILCKALARVCVHVVGDRARGRT